MSIASEISRLQTAKADLKTAIEGKGVTVPSSTKLDGYADLVDSIETGGGGSYSDEWLYFNATVTVTDMKAYIILDYDSTKLELQAYMLGTDLNQWMENFNYGEPQMDPENLVSFRVKPRNLSDGETSVIEFKNGEPGGSTKPTYTFGMIPIYTEVTNYTQPDTYKFAIVSIT